MTRFKSFINVLSIVIFASSCFLSTNSVFAADNPEKVKVQGENLKAMTKININQASEKELVKNLNGIGASKAKAIIEYREKNGDFKSIDELAKVKGIGQKIIEKNKEKLTI